MAVKNMRFAHRFVSSEEFYRLELERFRAIHPTFPAEMIEGFARQRQRARDLRKKSGLGRYQRQKATAFAMLGGVCTKCGQDDERILEIDHITPIRGNRKRSAVGEALGTKGRGFQLLCVPCHKDKSRADFQSVLTSLRNSEQG